MAKPSKPKFYVVWKGHQPGVYANWDAASRQVSGFPGAQFKSFPSRHEAETAFAGAYKRETELEPPYAYNGYGDMNLFSTDAGIPTIMFGPRGGEFHAASEWLDVPTVAASARARRRSGRATTVSARSPHPGLSHPNVAVHLCATRRAETWDPPSQGPV